MSGIARQNIFLDRTNLANWTVKYGCDMQPLINLMLEKIRQQNRENYLQSEVNELWRTVPKSKNLAETKQTQQFPAEPQENILYFIEKHAPL